MKVILILSIAVVFILPSICLSDMFTPSPSCFKPSKPYQFNSQYEIDSFNEEVASYKRCITSFIEEQESGIENHQSAIEDAIQEWNFFVNLELN